MLLLDRVGIYQYSKVTKVSSDIEQILNIYFPTDTDSAVKPAGDKKATCWWLF